MTMMMVASDENLSNQINQININSVTEFQGVVSFHLSSRRLLLLIKVMIKRPSGYKHHLLLFVSYSCDVWPELG